MAHAILFGAAGVLPRFKTPVNRDGVGGLLFTQASVEKHVKADSKSCPREQWAVEAGETVKLAGGLGHRGS